MDTEYQLFSLQAVIKHTVDSRRTQPKTTAYDECKTTSDDTTQEFHLKVLQYLLKMNISFDDETYFDVLENEVGYDMSRLLMNDARRSLRVLNDQTTRRAELVDSETSYDLERLSEAITDGPDGMPTTTKQFDTFAELGYAIDSEADKTHDLSDAASELFRLFTEGTTAQRRAILLMLEAARYVEQGVALPRTLTQKLKRVRKQVAADGWKLDPTKLR